MVPDDGAVPARFDLVTVTTPATDRLVEFYAAALGLVEIEREDGDRWVVLADPGGPRRLGFQRGAHRPGCVHLDLVCERAEFVEEVDRLIALGAELRGSTRAEPYGLIANLVDPAGNELDLVAYD